MKLLVLTLVFSLSAFGKNTNQEAVSQTNFQILLQLLPQPLPSIEIGKSSVEQVVSTLGKPLKTDEYNNHYYSLTGIKYDTTIGINKRGKVSYILHSPSAQGPVLQDVKPYIPKNILEKALENRFTQETLSHTSSRSFEIIFDKIKLVVQNNGTQSISTILLLE